MKKRKAEGSLKAHLERMTLAELNQALNAAYEDKGAYSVDYLMEEIKKREDKNMMSDAEVLKANIQAVDGPRSNARKHVHEYKPKRENPTVLVCDCGRFQHTGKFEPVVEKTASHTPYIWLQEHEKTGTAICGCELNNAGDDGPAFYQCPTHEIAFELLKELKRCRDLLLDSVNFDAGDKATTEAVSIADVVIAKTIGR